MDSILWLIREFAEIDSTNTYLAQEAQSGAPEGVVARAEFQSAGRGRLDRSWEAPRGVSLLASILLRPTVPPEQRFLVSAAVALSARTALTRLCGLQPALKWPNDLVVGDRKLGGLLSEVIGDGAGYVVGIGVNLQWPGPEGVGGTCVLDEIGVSIEPRAMLDITLGELNKRRFLLDTESGRLELHEELVGALATLGRMIRVERAEDSITGTAIALEQDGTLMVATPDGTVSVRYGDIVHLRNTEML
jgi:BirA family biotin operon repressor/biotin-[acetyl-CoA-carboxylase] ligase